MMNKYLKRFLSAGIFLTSMVGSAAFAGNPAFTGPFSTSTNENTTGTLFLVTVSSTSGPPPATDVINSLTIKPGVGDHDKFQLLPQTLPSPGPGLDATARLGFLSAPDYEAFADVGGTAGDNIYEVTIVAQDVAGHIREEIYTVTVLDVNDPPVAVADPVTVDEDTGSSGNVLSNDSDEDVPADTLTVSAVNGNPANVGVQISTGKSALVTIEANGDASYDPNGQFESLGEGESDTDSVTYTIFDGTVDGNTVNVNVTIDGVNDAPVLADGAITTAVEDGPSVDLDLSTLLTDDDINDGHTYVITSALSPGEGSASITLETLTFSPGSDFQDLREGQTTNVTLGVTATDDSGVLATEDSNENTVTITVTGDNDDPTVDFSGGGDTNSGSDTEDGGAMSASGTLTLSDVDLADTVSLSTTAVVATGETNGISDATFEAMLTYTGGDLTNLQTTGQRGWVFNSGGEDFDFLRGGDTLQLVYTVTATDDSASTGTGTNTITITITGANNSPVVDFSGGGDSNSGSDTEDGGTMSASGTLTVSDVDIADTVALTTTAVVATGETNGISDATFEAMLTYTGGNLTNLQTTGQRGWVFNSGGETFDFLRGGDTLQLAYTVTATDDATPTAATGTNTVTITITGANNSPVVDFSGGGDSNTGADTEDGGTLSASGTLTMSDVDIADTVTLTTTAVVATGETNGISDATFEAMLTYTGGNLTNLQTTGQRGWVFNSGGETFDFLRGGDTLQLAYTVTATDDATPTAATDTNTITITITGANNSPVVDFSGGGDTNSGADTEDGGTMSASGTLTMSDVDIADTVALTTTAVVATGETNGISDATFEAMLTYTGGNLTNLQTTGQRGWVFNSGGETFDFLRGGDTLQLAYTVTATDDATPTAGTGTNTITITITGANNSPVVDFSGGGDSNTGADTEDGSTLSASGTLTLSDVDIADTVALTTTAVVTTGETNGISDATFEAMLTYTGGDLTNLQATGQRGWVFNSGGETFDFLRGGDTLQLAYTVTATDDATPTAATGTNTVTITITGANNNPVVDFTGGGDTNVGADTEDGGTMSASGTLTVSDVDIADTVTLSTTAVATTGVTNGISDATFEAMLTYTGGNLTNLQTTGQRGWVFNSGGEDFDFLRQNDTLQLAYTVTATDDATPTAGTGTNTITITITGANNSPVVDFSGGGDTNTGADTEDGATLSASGTLTVADIDIADTVALTTTAVVTTGETNGIADATFEAMLTYTGGDLGNAETSAQRGWVFNSGGETFDFLRGGDTLQLAYTVTATDDSASAATATNTITITITGANNNPVVDFTGGGDTSIGADTEDGGTMSASGTLTVSDVDIADTVTLSTTAVVATGVTNGISDATFEAMLTYTGGNLTNLQTTGQRGWVFNSGAEDFDFLRQNDTLQLAYTVTATDDATPTAGTGTNTVTITITGANSAPVVDFSGGGDTNTGADTEDGATLSASGTLTVADIDIADTVALTTTAVVTTGETNGISDATFEAMLTYTGGDLGNAETSAQRGWVFNSGGETFDFLRGGDTLQLAYTVTATDDSASAATATNTITITITGANNNPVVDFTGGGDTNIGADTEDGGTMSASGTLTVSDVDIADTVTLTTTAVVATGETNGISDATFEAMLTYTGGNLTNLQTTGQRGWVFNSGGEDFDFLRQNDTLQLAYTVTATDDATPTAGTGTNTVTITITGANNNPVVDFSGFGDSNTGGDTEDGGTMSANGTLTLSDVDIADTVTLTTTAVVATGETNGISDATFEAMLTYTGGDLTNLQTTGQRGWAFNSGGETFDFLRGGDTLQLAYTVTATDDSASAGTGTNTITITITGANNDPVVDFTGGGDTNIGVDTEDGGTMSASGTLTVSDVDIADTVTLTTTAVATTGETNGISDATFEAMLTYTGGNLTNLESSGQRGWVFNSGAEDFDFLRQNDTLQLVYTVTATDDATPTAGTGTNTVTITITGANNDPVVDFSGGGDANTGADTEDGGTMSASGTLTVSDVDIADTVTLSTTAVVTTGETNGIADATFEAMLTYTGGDLTNLQTTGQRGWVFNSGAETFDFLRGGDTLQLAYTVTATDDSASAGTGTNTITITITGSNNAPVVDFSGGGDSNSGSATENNTANLIDTGTLTITDSDLADTVTLTTTAVAKTGAFNGISDATFEAMLTYSGGKGTGVSTAQPTWTWNSGSETFAFLENGETLQLDYTVTATDNATPTAGTDTNTITITITGSNFSPIVDFSGLGDSNSGAVTETNVANLSDNGTLTITDLDLLDTVALTTTAVVKTGATNGISDATFLSMLTYDAGKTTGVQSAQPNWTWDSGAETFNYLEAGETLQLAYTVTATDDSTPTAGTGTNTVTITITGSNFAPIVDFSGGGDTNVGSATESNTANLTDSGTLTITDLDLLDTVTLTTTAVAKTGATNSISDATFEAMLTYSGGKGTGVTTAQPTWTWDSGSETFAYLENGESLQLAYTVTATDNSTPTAGTDTNTITITITGTNFVPVVDFSGVGDSNTGAVTESNSANISDSGTLTITDLDLLDTVVLTTTAVGKTGVTNGISDATFLSMLTYSAGKPTSVQSAQPTWTWDSGAETFAYLEAGETLQLAYTVTATDDSTPTAGVDTTTVTVTITGSNFDPIVDFSGGGDSNTGSATENNTANLTDNGTLTITDLDLLDTVTLTTTAVAKTGATNSISDATFEAMLTYSAGKPTATTTAQPTWTWDSGAETFNYLEAGETLQLAYTVTATDDSTPTAGTGTNTITITITGSNFVPIVDFSGGGDSNTGAVTETNTANISDSGTLTITDLDLLDTVVLTTTAVVKTGAINGISDATFLSMLTYGAGKPTGVTSAQPTWTFDSGAETFAYLEAGETLQLAYTVTATDDSTPTAGVDTTTITVTITGSNFVPVVDFSGGGDSNTGSATESNIANLTDSGTLTVTDLDLLDSVTLATTAVAKTGATNGISDATFIAMLAHGGSIASGATTVQSTWSWDSGAETFNYLEAGETLQLAYTVTATDDSTPTPGAGTNTVTITITGSNFVPIVDFSGGGDSNTGSATETNSANLSDSGTLTITDLDLLDTVTLTSTAVVKTGAINGISDATFLSMLTYSAGKPTGVTTAQPNWTWDSGAETFNYLEAGETLQLVYTVTATDDSTPTAGVDTNTITITITGTNFDPVVDFSGGGDSNTGAVTETNVANITDSGTLTVTDVDLLDTVALTTTAVAKTGVTNGISDATFLSMLTYSGGKPSGVTSAQPTWTFDSGAETFNYLEAGETLQLAYTVTATDDSTPTAGTGTNTITITITGSNFDPVVDFSGGGDSNTGSATETNSANLTDSGTLTITDLDLLDTVTLTSTAVVKTGAFNGISDATFLSMLTYSAGKPTGVTTAQPTWTWDSGTETFNFLEAGETLQLAYTVTATDDSTPTAGTGTNTITITITGTNFVPVVDFSGGGDSNTGAVTETNVANITDSGTLTITDLDLLDTVALTTTAVGKTGATNGISDATFLAMLTYSGGKNTGVTTAQPTWTFDSGAETFAHLENGETLQLAYTVTATDDSTPTAGVDTNTITITITGTNFDPVVDFSGGGDSNTGGVTETNAANLTDTGTLTVTDLDLLDTVTLSTTAVAKTGAINGISDATFLAMLTHSAGIASGSTTVQSTWTFDSGAETFNYLEAGETLQLAYTVTATDDSTPTAGTGTNTVTITITGSNFDPIVDFSGIGDSNTGAVTETNVANITDSGTLTITDLDLLDTVALTTTAVAKTGATNGISDATFLAMLTYSGGKNTGVTTAQPTWTFDSGTETFAHLENGETLQLAYTVTATDDSTPTVAVGTNTITVTITGTNFDPVIDFSGGGDSNVGAVTETNVANLSDTGTLTVTDLDLLDTVTLTTTAVVKTGATNGISDATFLAMLTYSAGVPSGSSTAQPTWTWDSGAETFNYLEAGETLQLAYTVTATDDSTPTAGTGTNTVTITITGSNFDPIVDFSGGGDANTGSATETNVANLTDSGTLTITDLDLLDTVTLTTTAVAKTGATNSISDATFLAMLTYSGGKATGVTTAQPTWTWNSGTETFAYLENGETLQLAYTVTATDDSTPTPGTGTNTITITITGTNFDPIVDFSGVGDSNVGAVTETNVANITDNGTLTITDLDLLDTVALSTTAVGKTGATNGISDATFLAMLTYSAGKPTGVQTAQPTWTFDSGAETFAYLENGETLQLAYTVTATDDSTPTAATDTTTVTITITGTNFDPVVDFSGTGDSNAGGVTENNTANRTVSDTLTVTDLDLLDSVVLTTTAVAKTGVTNGISDATFLAMLTYSGGIGSGATTAQPTWTFDSGAETFGYLQNGETLVLAYTVTATDDSTPTAGTGTNTITITITGSNNDPVVDFSGVGDANTGAVTETNATNLTDNGTLTVADIDIADTVTLSTTAVSTTGLTNGISNATFMAMLTYSGGLSNAEVLEQRTWTFDSGTETFDYLDDGDILTLTYTVTADDTIAQDTAVITITVTGTNDLPTTTGIANQVNVDGDTPTLTDITGSFAPSADTGDSIVNYAIAAGSTDDFTDLGLTLTGAGLITGTISFDASQGSADGDGVYSITIEVTDDDGLTVDTTYTWTVTNVDPVATANTADILEDDIDVTGNVLTDDDGSGLDADGAPDGDALVVGAISFGATPGTVDGATSLVSDYGDLVIATNGGYTYTLDNSNAAVQGLGNGDTLTDTFTYTIDDGQGGTDSANLVVTITGTNDAPVVNDQTFNVDENSPNGTVVGTLAAFNAEPLETLTYALTGTAFAIDAAGEITVANSAALDREATNAILVTATVTDDGVPIKDDTATVTIEINPINDNTPVGNDDTVTVDELATALFNVLTDGTPDTDADLPAETLVVSAVGGDPANVGAPIDLFEDGILVGTLTIGPTGASSFVTNPDNTVEKFSVTQTYTVSDGTFDDPGVLVTIDVTPINDNQPQVTTDGTTFAATGVQYDEGTQLATSQLLVPLNAYFSDLDIDDDGILDGSTSGDNDSLVFTVVGNTNATVVSTSITDADLFIWSPVEDHGTADITIRATDTADPAANISFAELTFTVTVNSINDPPLYVGSFTDLTVNEDSTPTLVDLALSFTDADRDSDSDPSDEELTYRFTIEDVPNPEVADYVFDDVAAGVTLISETLDSPSAGARTIVFETTNASQSIPLVKDSHGIMDITIRATDLGRPPLAPADPIPLFVERSFRITVFGIGDDTPGAVDDHYSDFPELIMDEDGDPIVFNVTTNDYLGDTPSFVRQAGVLVTDTFGADHAWRTTTRLTDRTNTGDLVIEANGEVSCEADGCQDDQTADTSVSGAEVGELNIIYKPLEDFNGEDTFTYCLQDAFPGAEPGYPATADPSDPRCATVTVLVNPVNDLPRVPADIIFTMEQAGELNTDATTGLASRISSVDFTELDGVLCDPGDPTDISCRDTLYFFFSYGALTSNGALIPPFATDGSFTYRPDVTFSGSDSFQFDVCETPVITTDSCVFGLTATIVVDPILGAPVGSTDDVVQFDFDLADIPLELPVGPESNVLIVNDDSGSMGWDILTDQSSGLYYFSNGSSLRYVMKATAGSTTYVAPGEEDAPDIGLWRLRNSTYNTVYYNPEIRYEPWEGLNPDGDPFPNSTPTSALHNPMAPSGSSTNLRLPQDYTGRALITTPRTCTTYCRRYRRGVCVSFRTRCTGGTSFQEVPVNDLYLPRYYIWNDSTSTGVVGELDATPSPITDPSTSEGTLVEIRPASESGGYPTAGSGTYPKGAERTDCVAASYCTYDEELQNFANWFTYSRNREYTAKSALGKVVAASENIKIGYAKLNSSSNTKRIVSMNTSERTGAKAELLDAIYLTGSSGGTPLRRALRDAGRHFECRANDIFNTSSNSSPGDANCPVEPAPSGNCQQNYTLLITDGTWNGGNPYIGDADDNNNTNFDGGMYAHSYDNSLADVAMHYYERDLQPTLSNEVPTSSRDVDGAAATAFENGSNELMHQHMKTYTVGFGVNGNISDADVPTDYTVTTFDWGNPTSSTRKIDDVRHAAVNGRGEYLSASDAARLADALVAAFEEFQQGSGAASAVSFNSQEILEDTLVFRSFYNTKNNTGDLIAQSIDVDGTVTEEPVWSAAEQLDLVAPLDRDIITIDRKVGSATFNQGIAFLPTTLNADQQAAFTNETIGSAQANLEVLQRVMYLRGDATNERPTGNFRERPGIEGRLGDIVHSAPTFIGIPSRLGRDVEPFPQGTGNLYSDFREANEDRQAVVYVNANDGMLHGFNANTGDEMFAYVPDVQMTGTFSENIAQLLGFDYDHKYLVDSTPAVNDVYIDADGDGDKEWRTILVSGHGKGAKSYFALDITDPTKFDETTANDVVMWEFNDDDDTYPTDASGNALRTSGGGTREDLQTPPQPVKDLGYTYSVPTLVMTNAKDSDGDNRWVALAGNGYNSTAGIAKLLILFLDGGVDGEWCHPDRRHDVVLDGPAVSCGQQDFIKMDTGFGVFDGLPNGLGEPRAIDVDGSGTVDYVYAGDLQGNFFRFDLTDPDIDNWTTTKIFEAKYKPGTADEAIQPITTQPIAIIHPTEEDGFIIVFGTGAYLRTGDSTDSAIQSVYGIWDRLGPTLVTKSELQEQTFTNLVDPTFGRVRVLSDNDVNYGVTTQKGWFIDLDAPPAGFADGTTPEFPGEKAIRNIQLRGGLAFVNSVFPRTQGSCVGQAGGAALSFCPDTGGSGCFNNRTVFDLNNDGAFDADDDIGSNQTAAGIILEDPSPPTDSTFIGDKRVTQYGRQLHIIGTNTSSGDNTGRLSWKQLRTN